MPITREDFQIRNTGDEDDLAEEFADVSDADKVGNIADTPAIFESNRNDSIGEARDESSSRSIEDARASKSAHLVSAQDTTGLPTADTTSAEKREAVGVAHPEREARRSVATGRDVPQFTPRSQKRERMEFNWDEARQQSEVYERRARAQKEAATEHLARIHDIVGLLVDMSETHSKDARTKLESLERKVADLETRFSVNRLSP